MECHEEAIEDGPYYELIKELGDTVGNSAERLLPLMEERGIDTVRIECGRVAVLIYRPAPVEKEGDHE